MRKRCIALTLCLALVAALAGCGARPADNATFRFYYYSPEPDYKAEHPLIRSEQRDLAIYDNLEEILKAYLQGPQDPSLQLPLPRDTTLLRWTLEKGSLRLEFSREFSLLTGVELSVACGCIAKTFFELDEVHRVIISAEDSLLEGLGAIILTPNRLMLHDDSMDRLVADYTLYYTDNGRRYLIGREETVNMVSMEGLEINLVERLLASPEGSGLVSALPTGTRVLGVQVSEGICTVNLSREFELNADSSAAAQRLTLLSVVNTLTQLDHIDRVEFAVEGDLLLRYGQLRIDDPLVREEGAVGPVRAALGEMDATLYFCDGSERLLLAVPTRIRPGMDVSAPEAVARALLEYRPLNGLTAGNEAGATLRAVSVTGGICRVDLSGEVLSQPDRLPILARCLAASLCALDGIDGVVLTVEGEIPDAVDSRWFEVLTPQNNWFL